MTKLDTAKILAILKAAYPNVYKGMNEKDASDTVLVWSIQFSAIPVEIVAMAVQKCISVCTFPPTVAEVKEKLKSMYWEARESLCMNQIASAGSKRDALRWVVDSLEPLKASDFEPAIADLAPSCGGRIAASNETKQIADHGFMERRVTEAEFGNVFIDVMSAPNGRMRKGGDAKRAESGAAS